MGPEAAKSFPGHELVHVTKRPAPRAQQELDYGRRGKGYVFGAFQPATGETRTGTAPRRTTANFVAFLEHSEAWIDPAVERVYAILDNLSAHRAGPPALGVRLPAQVCRLLEPD
jgi:hypothetical protein